MQLTITGFFAIAILLLIGFWLGKNKPGLLGGMI